MVESGNNATIYLVDGLLVRSTKDIIFNINQLTKNLLDLDPFLIIATVPIIKSAKSMGVKEKNNSSIVFLLFAKRSGQKLPNTSVAEYEYREFNKAISWNRG